MPASDDDERYARMLINTVADLSRQLGTVRAEIKEDAAQLLRTYREDNHRAIMGIYVRLVSIEDTFETERSTRIDRQKLLDGRLDGIEYNQRFLVRLAVIAGILALGVVIGWIVL